MKVTLSNVAPGAVWLCPAKEHTVSLGLVLLCHVMMVELGSVR